MPTEVILIRHGITVWNRQKRYCGSKDIALSSQGRVQALRLRKRLKGIKCDRVYSSDRKRAARTARIIFGRARIIWVKGLREIDFGALEGLNYNEIMQKYPAVYKKWLKDPFKTSVPQGEAMGVFGRRVNSAMKKIVGLNRGKTVAVVCHGGTISIFINSLLKKRDFWRYIPAAGSMSIVEYGKNGARIKLFNDTGNLS